MNNYLKIKQAYKESNLKAINQKIGFPFSTLVFIILLIWGVISIYFIEYNKFHWHYFVISYSVIFTGIAYLHIYYSKKFISIYGEGIKPFLQENRIQRRAERALLFFEKLVNNGVKIDTIRNTDTLDDELKLKKFNFIQMPYFTGAFTIVGLLLSAIFSKLSLFCLVFLLGIIVFIICLSLILMPIFRIEEEHLKDLKLFLIWYKEFGYDLIMNNRNIKEQVND